MTVPYRKMDGPLLVTKPDGEAVTREVTFVYDVNHDLFEVRFKGESILQGYSFGVFREQFRKVKEEGEPCWELPA